jgi:hypothetical protein
MAKAHVLDKVAVDLSHGHTQPAIQRLSSLVAAHPHDLDLRHRLAAVHRMTGNTVEAGRWDYLSASATPAETEAFERAFPSPQRRLSKLLWTGSPDLAPTEHARQRLAALAEAAGTEHRPAESDNDLPRWGKALGVVVYGLGAVGFLALIALGAVTVVGWFR